MAQFNLSDTADSSKVFLVKRSELEGRIDPNQYHFERRDTINKLKKNNKTTRLKDIVSNEKKITTEVTETDIYVGLENIKSETGEYISTNEKLSISSAGVFKKGQILFPKLRPYLNKVYLAEFDGICSTEFHVFQCKPNFLNEFLSIYLRSSLIVNQTKHLMTGNTLPRLQTEDINNLPVPIISLNKQKEIINLYQTAYTQKQQKEAQAAALLAGIDTYLLNELGITLPEKDTSLQSRIFTTMFSEVSGGRFESQYHTQYNKDVLKSIENSKYPVEKIKNHTQFISGYAFSSDSYIEFSECYLITIKNISKNTVELENVTYLPNHFFEDYSKFQINRNDLLIAMTGATIGKVGIYESDDKALLNQRNGIIKSNSLNTFYLMNLLNTEIYQSLILKNSVGGAQPNISETDITRIGIPLPPPEKQTEIANHIQGIRAQAKQLQEEAKAVLEDAKQEVEKMILG